MLRTLCLLQVTTIRSNRVISCNTARYASSMASLSVPLPPLISGVDAVELYGKRDSSQYSNIRFIDGTWRLGLDKKQCIDEHIACRIPTSTYFNIDEVSDSLNALPHMLPCADEFKKHCVRLGVRPNDNIVIYVNKDSFAAPRVWWMFKVFGYSSVSIVNGGLPAWIAAGGPTVSGTPTSPEITSESRDIHDTVDDKYQLNDKLVVDVNDVLDVVNTGNAQIIDARSLQRFNAEVPEPRPGLISGHIPGSMCIPFTSIVKADDVTTFKSLEEIRDVFVITGVVFGCKTLLTCGSGVSAAVLAFGLQLLGKPLTDCPIYDGSWSEWGQKDRDDLPRITAGVKKDI